jgi:hypothetical protein
MKLQFALFAVSFALLTGCDSKPPGCGDSQIVEFMNTRLSNHVINQVAKETANLPPETRIEVERLTRQYLKEVSIGFSNIVTDGYDANAKRHVCAARMTLKTLKETGVYPIEYVIQKTEDPGSDFVVATDSDATVFGIVFSVLRQYLAEQGEIARSKGVPPSGAAAREPIVYQTSQTQEAEAKAATAATPATTPDGFVKYAKADGELLIKKTGNQAQFKISSSRDQHSCEMEGAATMSSDTDATYKPDVQDKCTARLKFSAGQIEVKTQACDDFCGTQAGGSMDGIYKR